MSEDTPPAPAQQETSQPKAPQQQREEVKSKPAPAPAPQFHVIKQGFVQRQGHLWRSWYRQWMTLDEDGAALRWYKTEQRTGSDGTLYMSKCAEVSEPKEGLSTNWPAGTEGRCFVVCSPNRAHYIVAESEEDKRDWMQKLTEAKSKFNTSGVGIVSVSLLSVEAIKVTVAAEVERAQGETDRTLAAEGTSTEKIGKDLDKAAQDTEKELKKESTAQQEQVVTKKVEAAIETEVKIEADSEEVKVEAGGSDSEEVKIEAGGADSEEVEVGGSGETGDVEVKVEATEGEAAEVKLELQVEMTTGDEEQVTAEVEIATDGGGEVQQATEEEGEEEDPPPPAAEDDAGKEE